MVIEPKEETMQEDVVIDSEIVWMLARKFNIDTDEVVDILIEHYLSINPNQKFAVAI